MSNLLKLKCLIVKKIIIRLKLDDLGLSQSPTLAKSYNLSKPLFIYQWMNLLICDEHCKALYHL